MTILPTTEKFDRIYRSLLVADVHQHLYQLFPPRAFPPEEDLAYALSVATRLALSGSGDTLESAYAGRRAYEVAIRALTFANGSKATMRTVCDLILSRVGNFPALRLLQEQTGSDTYSDDPFLRLEILVRRFENKLRGTAGETILTDFQVRLIRALEANTSVSVSAPTSAGKSFTLEIELLRRLKDDASYVAVFLVPTRALIRQVTLDLVGLLREHDLTSVPVLSAPTVPEGPDTVNKAIYILTQERLATLLAAVDSKLRVDALIVDEAHEIGEPNRGQTLERVLWATLVRFPNARLFFSSPLRSNPELLLSLFGREKDGQAFVEHLSPVTQNIINVHKVSKRKRTARLELVIDDAIVPLGTVDDLPFDFRGRYMGHLAFHFTGVDESAIVYCNEPAAADKVAFEIAELMEDQSSDPELAELSTFLRQEVHHLYRLAGMVRKGVAFHYGNIPQIIRGRIEELLRDRKIRFVCCTSTLLQGMNLPAKNIFVEDPKKGRGKSMQTGDFWNLVGRAGRLSKEFQGNVFCIYGKDWERDVTSARMATIESAFEVAITRRTSELVHFVKEPPESPEARALSWAEQTYARIYADFVGSGRLLATHSAADQKIQGQFSEIDALSAAFKRTLPGELFINNLYLHPARLETLAAFFRSQANLDQWIPGSPYERNSFRRFTDIFGKLEDLIIRTGTLRYRYLAPLAVKWMQGSSLKDLVNEKIDYEARQNRGFDPSRDVETVNSLIRDLFEDLERELRYTYVKYMRVYNDVLHAILIEKGLTDRAEKLLPIHLFLEYGAASQTLINLMATGLSRTSALLFASAFRLRSDLNSSECQGYLDRVNIELVDVPAICKAEIRRLRRTKV
jgi:superfamily II DNA/RNA helicase